MRRPGYRLRRAAGAALASLLLSCDGRYSGPGGATGGGARTPLSVSLAATPIEGLDSLTLWVSQVYAEAVADSSLVFTVTRSTRLFDLLTLRDTVSPPLDTVSVPEGDYRLRVVVDSVRLRFTPPGKFSNGDTARTLRVPVSLRAGAPVTFPVTAAGRRVLVVVSIDAARSLRFSGSVTTPTSAEFIPVLHGVVDSVAASIAGTVHPIAARATLYGVLEGDTVATALADTASGAYRLRLLPPGAITIVATGTGLSTQKTVVVRAGQDTTGVAIP